MLRPFSRNFTVALAAHGVVGIGLAFKGPGPVADTPPAPPQIQWVTCAAQEKSGPVAELTATHPPPAQASIPHPGTVAPPQKQPAAKSTRRKLAVSAPKQKRPPASTKHPAAKPSRAPKKSAEVPTLVAAPKPSPLPQVGKLDQDEDEASLEISSYLGRVQRVFEKSWKQPAGIDANDKQAMRASVAVVIARDGRVSGVRCLKESSIPKITESALVAAHTVSRIEPLPTCIADDSYSVTIHFEIH